MNGHVTTNPVSRGPEGIGGPLWLGYAWHRWFAWHPVRLMDHRFRWLCFVARRGVLFTPGNDVDFWGWDYAHKDLLAPSSDSPVTAKPTVERSRAGDPGDPDPALEVSKQEVEQ